MSDLPHVRLKAATYVFRRKVPSDLRGRLGLVEIVRSLRTHSRLIAKLRSRRLWVRTEELFQVMRTDTTLTEEQISRALHSFRADLNWADEQRFEKGAWHFDHHGSPPADADAICYEVHANELRERLAEGRIDVILPQMQAILKRFDWAVEPGSPSEQKLGKALLKTLVDSTERAAQRLRGSGLLSPVQAEHPQMQQALPVALQNDKHSLVASVAWEEFIKHVTKWRWKDSRKPKSALNLWTAVVGDIPLAKWTTEEAVGLRDLYSELPGRYAQDDEWSAVGDWRTKSGLKAIAKVFQAELFALKTDPRREEEWVARASRVTKLVSWNKAWSPLHAFWEWGRKNGYVPKQNDDPFEGLYYPKAQVKKTPITEGGSEKRKIWERDQLQLLFSSPLFVGCKSPRERFLSGTVLIQDALYWVPLILALSGARREEICQLKVEHVVKQRDTSIWYFDLKASGLKLKNPESAREIPLHEILLEVGFLQACVFNRDPDELLFPELYQSSDGRYGDKLGQNFAAYRADFDSRNGDLIVKLYERLRDLHSFRHTVYTHLTGAEVPPGVVEALIGHAGEARDVLFGIEAEAAEQVRKRVFDQMAAVSKAGDMSKVYDHGRHLPVLKAAIDKLDLDVDLTRLISAAKLARKH